ncbi:MAG: hypothetical protein H6722_12715 [Sandaracinus sp.]|nr:hypothetical protein [Sandaracinus sp.]
MRASVGLALVVALLATAVAHAQPDAVASSALVEVGPAVSVTELERLAGELRSEDAAVREHAFERLGHLPASALPAITERVRYLARLVIPPEDGEEALQRFRHATGSRRADDMIDVAPGILAVLAEDRSPDVGRSAERVLLIRSLEQIGTLDAWRTMADVYALSPEMWRWELRRALVRLGPRLMPALILARSHRDAVLRRWARDGADALRLANPADALQVEDLGQLAQLVTAYSEVRDLDAMPVIVGFVDHPDPPLREAARMAMERYGQNGIWQLRIAFRHKLAAEADLQWGWRRTMTELWSRLDEVRLAPQSARIDAAKQAMDEGRARDALGELELVLRETPTPPRADELASMLARLATELDDAEAIRLLRRALWLAPEHAEAATWRGRLALLEAEADRARGVLDLDAYEAAARLSLSEGERERVAAVLDEGDVETLTEVAEPEGPGFPWSALGLLALLVFAFLIVLPRVVAWCTAQLRRFRARRAAGSHDDVVAVVDVGSEDVREPDLDAPSPEPARFVVETSSAPRSIEPDTQAPKNREPWRRVVRALAPLGARVRGVLAGWFAAARAKLSPPVYGPAPKRAAVPRSPSALDPSLVLGAFASADPQTPLELRGDAPLDRIGDDDDDLDDDESFDFDAVVAAMHEPSEEASAEEAPSEATLADMAFTPSDDVPASDADAVLASLLLGADPNDTLPGAPAPTD